MFTPLLPDSRQALALYITGVAMALSAVLIWGAVTLRMAAHEAFSAGYRTVAPADEDQPTLRLVEPVE